MSNASITECQLRDPGVFPSLGAALFFLRRGWGGPRVYGGRALNMEMALIDPTPKARLQCVNPSGLNALCLGPPTIQLFIEEIALFFIGPLWMSRPILWVLFFRFDSIYYPPDKLPIKMRGDKLQALFWRTRGASVAAWICHPSTIMICSFQWLIYLHD